MSKSERILLRVTKEERTSYEETATASSQTLSEWIRGTLNVATVSYRHLASTVPVKVVPVKVRKKEKSLPGQDPKPFVSRLKGQWKPK